MANNIQTTGQHFGPQNVQEANAFLDKLKENARIAHDTGNIFMLNMYTELLKVASPIVVRAIARQEREERAAINKAHKALRRSLRASSQQDAVHDEDAEEPEDAD